MRERRLLSQYTPAPMDLALARDSKPLGVNQTKWGQCNFRQMSREAIVIIALLANIVSVEDRVGNVGVRRREEEDKARQDRECAGSSWRLDSLSAHQLAEQVPVKGSD